MQWKLFVLCFMTIAVIGLNLIFFSQMKQRETLEKGLAEPLTNSTRAVKKPCSKKYLLVATQRSGSTWVCSLLDGIDGIACGAYNPRFNETVSELIIKYSFSEKDKVEWSTYEKDLDKAFNQVCTKSQEEVIGFKAMYDQIPQKFLKDGKLKTYLRENEISIIHLVREAKILNMASKYNNGVQNKEGKKMHARDENDAKAFRDTLKLPWNDGLIDNMLKYEQEALEWQKTFHFMPHVPDYHLSYELLLNKKDKIKTLSQLYVFLKEESPDNTILTLEGRYHQLHETLCSDRIANYAEFRAHPKVQRSRSAAACDLINES